MALYKGIGANFYEKKNGTCLQRIKIFKEKHKVEYNYFWADTFLGMK